MASPLQNNPETAERKDFVTVSRIQSIKTQFLIFSLIATILPSVALGVFSYRQTHRFLNEKIAQELHSAASHVSRELDLWMKEQIYDVRVFSNSYILSENLIPIVRKAGDEVEKLVYLDRIQAYLKSVQEKFDDYEELMIVDLSGDVLATSTEESSTPELPVAWIESASTGNPAVGGVFFDPSLNANVLLIGSPVSSPGGELLGLLGIKLGINAIEKQLAYYLPEGIDEIYLVNRQGRILASTRAPGVTAENAVLEAEALNPLFERKLVPLTYSSYHDGLVVGTLNNTQYLGWGIVAEMDHAKAFQRIQRLKRLILMLVGGLLIGMGFCAYWLGLNIVRPLRRLSKGADSVATGDLQIQLPILDRSEVGHLTDVFNHMVGRLKSGREELDSVNAILKDKNKELHELSITDGLTGLYNRKYFMENLKLEAVRSRRHGHGFGLLIIDIDHFKQINDNHGHQVGDEVLCRMAELFRRTVRECDFIARYGGEEFIMILPEIRGAEALAAAERIREAVSEAAIRLNGKSISTTISIGVADYPEDADDTQELIMLADKALYAAKADGRNCVKAAARAQEA